LSADLHSLGQFIQDGSPIAFQTLLQVESLKQDISFFTNPNSIDYISELGNKKLNEVNKIVEQAVLNAHNKIANNPHFLISIKEFNEEEVGSLVQ
jgi:glucose-6-phosphate isomerase